MSSILPDGSDSKSAPPDLVGILEELSRVRTTGRPLPGWALARLILAVRTVVAIHAPVEWQEADENGEITEASLDKPLPPFCRECTDAEYVDAVEFGDTIDQGSPVVDWPCLTYRMVLASLAPEDD